MRREFKRGDYIVVLKLGSLSTDCAKENYCFKQRLTDGCLTPVRDLVGDRNNANRTLKFDKSDRLLDWRYATDEEIVKYNELGKPYDVTILNKTTMTTPEELLEKARRDYPIGTKYIGIRDGDIEKVRYTPSWVPGQDGNIEGGLDYIYLDGEWAKIVMPVENGLPRQYIVATTTEEETNEVTTHIKGCSTAYKKYKYVICHDGLLDPNKKDRNIWNRIPNEVEHFPTLTYQEWFNLAYPTNSIPEKWYMVLDGLSDKELKLCNEWRRSVCTIRKYSRLESYYTLLNCHSDESYYYGSDCIDTIKAERWANGIKEITFEQFKKYILKQENKEVMKKQTLTVTASDVLQIHYIACSTWKERIAKFLTRVDNDQNITFTQEEVDTMFECATETQLPVLEDIFGKQVKEPTLKDMADGKPLFREDPNGGATAMIEVRIGYGDLKDKAFWLNTNYNWELKRDNEGTLCLVPTPKK